MKCFASLTLLVTLLGCGHHSSSESMSQVKSEFRREFTGKAAEDIITALGTLGLNAQDSNNQPIFGYALESVECTAVPSPRATPVCHIQQGENTVEAGALSLTIYEKFVQNGAQLQLEAGVTRLKLSHVICERYNVYRGVSKCFFS